MQTTDIHSFIVRIWAEQTDNQGQVLAWRGSVEHVGKNQRVYFSALDELVTFLQNKTGIDPNRRLPPQINLRLT